jgi:threonine dehydrogenase-like Zn-dependent dehydrogenase
VQLRRPKSLSVVFPGPGQVELREERLARPRRGEELLEARCSLVSTGTERTCLERDFEPGSHWDEWVQYPFRPGYSFVGVTGAGARVCAHAPHAQRAVLPGDLLIPVPDGVSDADASWFALASIAQIGIAAAEISPGDSVVVLGTGVLGQLVAQLARVAGADSVIVVAGAGPRLDAALAHGASAAIAATAAGAREEVLARTDGEGAAIVFDVTGSEPVFADALKLARRHGTVVLLGDAGHPAQQHLAPELLLNGLRVVGAHFEHADTEGRRQMAAQFFEALQLGSVVVGDLITQRARPEDAPALYASLAQEDRGRIGVLFDWGLA